MKLTITLLSYFLFLQSYSQTNNGSNNQEKIKNYIETYFKYDRENIHVQFNKNIYLSNEDIAFKGYVYSKNNNSPNHKTSNIRLEIRDDQQQIVSKQLLFSNKGVFNGGLHLSEKFKTGKYYFHFFTNWMNNYKEDDSYIETIEIINKSDSYQLKSKKPNWKTAEITFTPEGGSIVADITNNIGVAIKDCNKKGIEVKDIVILDSKLNEVSRFNTNKMGYGVLYLNPDLNEKYILKINSENLTLSQPLPTIQETGITLTYNNNLKNNKLAVAIRTNEKGLSLYQNKKIVLLIHQDGNSLQQQFNFDNNETEKVLLFDKNLLSNGVNSIRIIDENLNEITERLIYNDAATIPTTSFEAKVIANDSIQLSGKTNFNLSNLSISVLPENNVCLTQKGSIQGTFYLNAYLANPETDNYLYFDPENKDRIQDLELLMINQKKSKYLWENILTNPPKMNIPFDKGITIKGKVDKKISPNSKYKISLISLKDNVFESTPVDSKNEFIFENFYAKDSTVFILQLINEKGLSLHSKIEARATSNEPTYEHPVWLTTLNCPIEKKLDTLFTFIKPKDNTVLNEVIINNNFKKEVLTHKNDMSLNAKSFKIGDNEFGNVLDFIGFNGYQTGLDKEDNNVYIRNRRGGGLASDVAIPPNVFIDNQLLFDLNLLFSMNMDEVDEIYIDQSGASDTGAGGNGTIKIFLKKGIKNDYFRVKYSSLIVTNGFSQNIEYKPSEFDTQKEYFYFGTLNWTPEISPKDNSPFEIKFPRGGQNNIQVLVEGFNKDGQLISEIKRIPIANNN